MRRPVVLLAGGLLGIGLLLLPRQVAVARDDAAVVAEADWMLSVQTPDGAFTLNQPRTDVNPYFASIGARGLARAAATTGNAAYSSAVWRWLDWYGEHLNTDGTIDDYTADPFSPGDWMPANRFNPSRAPYDSSDSYAATFLSAAAEIYTVTGDLSRLSTLRDTVVRVFDAMRATTRPDHLTGGTPWNPIAYLMDNVEVLDGLGAAEVLFNAFGDTSRASTASTQAQQIAPALQGFWDPAARMYAWAKFPDGTFQPSTWTEFYPSSVAQAWIVSAGLVEPSRASVLMNALDYFQPDWDEPMRLGWNFGQPAPEIIQWHPRIALAFVTAGRAERAAQALGTFESHANATQRAKPFLVASAGTLVMLAEDLNRLPAPWLVSALWLPRSVAPFLPSEDPCPWRVPC